MGLLDLIRAMWHGCGRAPRDLMAWLDMGESRFQEFEPAYHRFALAKRSGGSRLIDAPDRWTARVQRAILDRMLRKLPVHPAATGFRSGVSIVDNAMPHVGKDIVVRLDLRDFFPTITVARVEKLFRRVGWNRPAARWLASACTHEGRLPQGAPTSPALSNLVCFRLDARLHKLARRFGADYTRYADDITFSLRAGDLPTRAGSATRGPTPHHAIASEVARAMHTVLRIARRVIADEGFRINGRKTRILRRHQRQTVTGLVVNDRVNLPRETRRLLRAIRHRRETQGQSTLSVSQLAGWSGFERMVQRQRDEST